MPRWIVAVLEFCSQHPPTDPQTPADPEFWSSAIRLSHGQAASNPQVIGENLERLVLPSVAGKLIDHVEIWRFARREGESDQDQSRPDGTRDQDNPALVRRVFGSDGPSPYSSAEAVNFTRAVGVPDILCVWGLGVNAALLDACASSIKIYTLIDAPALSIPDELAARFDLLLSGADWQSREIEARIPDARTLSLLIGPAFASAQTFFPKGAAKDKNVIYVACAQPYKRHNMLFDTIACRPGTRGLRVAGYGDQTDEFHERAARDGLEPEIIGALGISHRDVNHQMNRARGEVLCGEHDGAPAILTEYQLAGLPVLANARLSCGLQFLTLDPGLTAHEWADFAEAFGRLLRSHQHYNPRSVALARWGWRPSIATLAKTLERTCTERTMQ